MRRAPAEMAAVDLGGVGVEVCLRLSVFVEEIGEGGEVLEGVFVG